MNVTLSEEMSALVREVSIKENIAKEAVVIRAFALLKLSEDVKRKGQALGVIQLVDKTAEHENYVVVGKIVGL